MDSEKILMVVFGVGFFLYMFAVLMIGITCPIILLSVGIIAGIVISFVV